MAVSLTKQQHAVIENRGGELLVSAAAGSGKTFVLVRRLLNRVMEEHLDLDHFLIITFTKAAASELRGKIIDALNEELARDPENLHLRRQSTLVYHAQISTIHAFCQMVIQEEGHNLNLDPGLRVADETTCKALKDQVLENVLEKHYEVVETGDAFSHLLDTMSAGRDDKTLIKMVLEIHKQVQSFAYPYEWLHQQCSQFALENVSDAAETTWGRILLEDSLEQTEYWIAQISSMLNRFEGKLEENYGPAFFDLRVSLSSFEDALREALANRHWDTVVERNVLDYGTLKQIRKPENPALVEQAKAVRDACKSQMKKVLARFDRSSDLLLQDIEKTAPAVLSLMQLVEEFDEAYIAEKRRQKLVDFADLEHLSLRLLVNEEREATSAARRIGQRYAEVMVDEYQDTNQVQNAIFNAITDKGQRLFMVGDVKQSIYRFRLADPTIFLDKLGNFPDWEQAEADKPRRVILSKNFRSRKSVLDAANFMFRSIMHRDFAELDYTDEHYLYPGMDYPPSELDHTELDVLMVPGKDEGDEEPKPNEKEPTSKEIEMDFVAKRILRLMHEQYPITEGDHTRPIEWTDIAILQRSPSSTMKELTSALDRHQIPWQSEGERDFFSSIEISTAMSYLEIIDNPHQDVPLLSVLNSPLFSFTPDLLAEIRAGCRDQDFYTALCTYAEAGNAACRDFLSELEDMRFLAKDRSAAGLLWEMYEQSGMLSIFGSLDGGEQRRNNLIRLYEYARQFERNGYRGLFDFVSQLRRLRDSGETLKISSVQGSGVRIMSIHKSKGLEFPVVILSNLSHRFNHMDERAAMLFHDKLGVGPKCLDVERGVEYTTLARRAVALEIGKENKAEEVRLLYVAMTRAKEKLIMTCTIKKAGVKLAKLRQNASWPMHSQVLKPMDCMADWILSAAMTRRQEGKVLCSGGEPLNTFPEADSERDTPWEINLLDGGRPETYFAAKEPVGRLASVPYSPETLQWVYPYEGQDIPSTLTATQLKGRFQDLEIAENAQPAPRPIHFNTPDFMRGKRGLTPTQRGTAQHLFIQLCDPEKTLTVSGAEEELRRLVERDSLTEMQAASCDPAGVSAFFRSELGRMARKNNMVREFKFSLLVDAAQYYGAAVSGEKIMLQGVVDLWFATPEGITVVDFKTDTIASGQEARRAEHYRTQMDVYTSAMERITGQKVIHRYLWFFRTGSACEI